MLQKQTAMLQTQRALVVISLLWLFGTMARAQLRKSCPGIDTCECLEQKYATQIFCKPVVTMAPITVMLEKHFLDKTVSFLELSTCSVTNFTDNTFSFSRIKSIKTYCPLQEIGSKCFVDVKGLKSLYLDNSAFTKIPEGVHNLLELQVLSLTNHAVNSLGQELWNMTALKTLVLRNGKLGFISNDTFRYSKNLTFLSLPYNVIEHIDGNTFDPLENIRKIDLSENHLVTVEGLFTKLNPQVIDLYGNTLSDVSEILHADMWKLGVLQLGHNDIRKIEPEELSTNAPNLVLLDLQYNKLSFIDGNLFHGLDALTTLYLNYNGMKGIPKGIFKDLTKLKLIDAEFNYLQSTKEVFVDLPELQTLKLSHNEFSDLTGVFRNLPKLKTLYMSRNELTDISQADFLPLSSLEITDLSVNHISALKSDVFASLVNLQSLNISYNPIPSFNTSIAKLASLENLQAIFCRLQYAEENDFKGLNQLRRVILANNNLSTLNGAFRYTPNLQILGINGNSLQTLSRDTFHEKMKLTEIYMRDNPWVCDCRLLWLVHMLSEGGSQILVDKPYCTLPERLQGMALTDLTVDNVTEWKDDCPEPCTCECKPYGRDFYVLVNCTNKNLSSLPKPLPKPLGELVLEGNNFRSASVVETLQDTEIKLLDLTDNVICDVNTSWPSSLQYLMLEGNQISRIPQVILDSFHSMKSLTLSRNPWICDCETLSFKKWLTEEKHLVSDVGQVRCGSEQEKPSLNNRIIISLSDQDLCSHPSENNDISLYIIVGGSVVGAAILLMIFICIYQRYAFSTKAWLYDRGATCLKKDADHLEKTFDVLLSYSPADSHLAQNVIAPALLAATPPYTVCNPRETHRNLNPLSAVRMSRRILAILSPEYLDDRSCMAVFRLACTVSEEENVNRIIPLKYGKLPSSRRLDESVATVLSQNRCLYWGERLFWEKMRYALPIREEPTPCYGQQDSDDAPLLGDS